MGNASGKAADNTPKSVHPHVHGERRAATFVPLHAIGSSPRTWGTHRRISTRRVSIRFIPTYMGNANRERCRSPISTVHPHVHGERAPGRPSSDERSGSSPRTWGTRARPGPGRMSWRFIPTYMGNAPRPPEPSRAAAVHPHVHGERHIRIISVVVKRGSSPRTWGTQALPDANLACCRFIPTYMGNAYHDGVCGRRGAVHPHVHGERNQGVRENRVGYGSSPRTWGTRALCSVPIYNDRFIPTYMGNARSRGRFRCFRTVHPHVHGERTCTGPHVPSASGSSPRTWGMQFYRARYKSYRRFIPTYMGNAILIAAFIHAVTVHPHVHGER
mgnify:CR=1 FL=1